MNDYSHDCEMCREEIRTEFEAIIENFEEAR